LTLGLILKEPDLGTSLVLAATLFLLFFIAGLPWKQIAVSGALCFAALVVLIAASPYRMRRMTAFLHPDATHQGEGYQIEQAKLALGAGGLTGKWVMGGRQRFFYLPEPHTDCIFASLGEEMGLIGTTLVLLGFGLVMWRGYHIALNAPNPFGQYLAFGLTSLIALQTLFNLLVVTGMAPPKGIALPFFSAGGSSMVISLAIVGILLNISQHGRAR
jgi:cell division protein FtsW